MNQTYLERALAKLLDGSAGLKDRRVVLGFDGFVDHIVSPIRKGNGAEVNELYTTIEQFGQFLVSRSGKSCSVELRETGARIGGNAPITANAVCRLGANVTCIGALGYPRLHPVFEGLPDHCTVISVEEPGMCIALEFEDGKVLMAMNKGINNLDWQTVQERAGRENLKERIAGADLLGLLNWSELPGASGIWRGILAETAFHARKDQWALFDLADCERREPAECLEALQIISDYGKSFKTVLSLNANEARHMCGVILGQNDLPLEEAGALLAQRLGIEAVVFHYKHGCMAFEVSGISRFQSFKVEKPATTTGAGDHFNAGLASALLCGMETGEALAAASSTASYYVANGHSPSPEQLIGFMQGVLAETPSTQTSQRVVAE